MASLTRWTSDVLREVSDYKGEVVVSDNSDYAGETLPGLRDGLTGENLLVEEGGFFSGDIDGDGEMKNVNYSSLRFDETDSDSFSPASDFEATFGLSFTRSVKKFAVFTGPDPRIVEFQFNNSGTTSIVSWWTLFLIFPAFFRKKTINELQTLDSPPRFLDVSGNSLIVHKDGDTLDFISPIDGETGFLEKSGTGYHPKS